VSQSQDREARAALIAEARKLARAIPKRNFCIGHDGDRSLTEAVVTQLANALSEAAAECDELQQRIAADAERAS
jgi:hypothetical protein